MKKITIYSLLLMLGIISYSLPVSSQATYQNRLPFSNIDLQEYNGELYLQMDINPGLLNIGKDQSLILIPTITNGQQSMELPGIMLNGKIRQKAYERALNNSREKTLRDFPYMVINYKDQNNLNGLRYSHSVPFESWMSNAYLDIKEDWCGCGDSNVMLLTHLADVRVSAIPEPTIAYVQPAGEPVKTRSKSLDVFLDFPVNQTVIRPDYMNNPQELQKINNMLSELRNDQNLTVSQIAITGYASPEGAINNNQRLSEGRANALKDYLVSGGYFPSNVFSIHYGGENWDGLRQAMEESSFEYKNEVLSVLSSTYDANARKNELKRLHNGVTYRQLLNNYYPRLRKAICHVTFNVKDFTVDEAKQIIRTNPEYLSLNEMYYVANSYPKGSQDFTNVFETAARVFPNDPVANLNVAAAALDSKDYNKAQNYLRNANNNSAEYANNMGIYYMYTGDADRARAEFEKAARGGFSGARENLEILDRYIQTGKIRNY